MLNLNKRRQIQLLRLLTHVGALLPLAVIGWDIWQGQLSADPIRDLTLRTGKSAIILLFLSLACTPANILLGWKQVLPLRKPLGLYAFLYVCIHLSIFVWVDYGLRWGLIREAIFEKRYALAGFAAFVLLVPLAATSTKWAMRKLGKNWKKLHRLVYLVGILAVIHFIWLVKQAYTEPIIFAAILTVLLLVRITPVKQRIMRWRRSLGRSWRNGRFSPTNNHTPSSTTD